MFLDINHIGEGSLSFDQTFTLARVPEDHSDLLESPRVRLHGTVTVRGPFGTA